MNAWRVESQHAAFESDPWRVEFAPAKPQSGLSITRRDGSTYSGVLAIDFPGARDTETVSDCYPRGVDLVTTYEQHADRTVLPHIYIRVVEASDSLLALQLIVSMQTSLLASAPATVIRSPLQQGPLQCLDANGQWSSDSPATPLATLQRLPNNVSFFQAIHPSDFESTADLEPKVGVGYRVFGQSLEKGVIRRARIMAGLTATHEDDANMAKRCFEQQLSEAPPLTT